MEDIRHINAISLYVADIARSEAFYQSIFGARVDRVCEDNIVVHFGGLLLNLLQMSLAYAPTDPGRGPLPLELNIWVDRVDEVYEALTKRGASFLAPPPDQPWGMRNITLFDPDGHRFEFAQQIS